MKRYPPVPHVEDAPADLLDGGHLWLQELLDGAHLRFQLRQSGELRFGDRTRIFDDGSIPEAYDHAVRYVRERLDREALRSAVDDVESIVFFAEAMYRQSVDYAFYRTPPVLGFDVFDADRGRFLPPDGVERVYERLGLRPVNTFEKEVRATDFSVDSESIPESAWRDGPAAGLFVRDKTGNRAKLPNPEIEWDVDPEPLEGTAETLAERYATDSRLDRIAHEADAVSFETLYGQTLEEIRREIHPRLSHGQTTIDPGEFRAAVAARTRRWLADRE